MKKFADRLNEEIIKKDTPCIVGLDPRVGMMPDFIVSEAIEKHGKSLESAQHCIVEYHRRILDIVGGLVPAVKPQIAFYEQYGVPGMKSFAETIRMAKERGLLVIVDAKRNDISSTAQAYANTFLGKSNVMGEDQFIYNADCITISPYLGEDSITPFVETCKNFGKGIFVLVKTSNPGSKDFQDLNLKEDSSPLYLQVAKMVKKQAETLIGESGYSSIGAVVGATFPQEAQKLRELMPKSIFLVPGYGAQGGTAKDVVPCFNSDGLGAVVNASRSITYAFDSTDISENDWGNGVYENTVKMIKEIRGVIKK